MRTLWCVAGRGMTDVGTLGGKYSQALGISPDGRVVGASTRVKTGPAIYYAFVWDHGVMTDLGVVYEGESSAAGINAAGQIVGTRGGWPEPTRPVVWTIK